MKISIKDLNFPAKKGMAILQESISEEILWEMIKRLKDEDKKARTIILPSAHELRKSLAFFFGQRVERGETTWEKVAKVWRGELAMKDTLSIKEMRRLYEQRKKEILREKR